MPRSNLNAGPVGWRRAFRSACSAVQAALPAFSAARWSFANSAAAAATTRAAAAATKVAATAPAKDGKKSYTPEEKRGGHFFTNIRVWRILHNAEVGTLFNKQGLAERYFEDIRRDENPDPEPIDDMLENDPDDDWGEVPDDADAARSGVDSGKLARPYNPIRERHKRNMQRAILKLQKDGVEIENVDKHGNVQIGRAHV